jgi:hypothetical protein
MARSVTLLSASRFIAPFAVLFAGLLLRPTPTAARPDYTRRTKQECSYCHLPGGWRLNDAGEYFEKHRSLNGYQPPPPPKQTAGPKPTAPESVKSK